MKNYNLSVVIPTKNRQQYCILVIRQVVKSTSDQVEIVIQDNSDDDRLRTEIELLDSERVIYNYEKRPLSFVENFNKALSIAHGEYLCLIGDDDGILPNIEDAVRYAKYKNLDALIPETSAVYLWPSKNPIVKGGGEGYLVVSNLRNRFSSVSSRDSVEQLLRQGFQDYQKTNIPRLYHGLIHRRLLEMIEIRAGAFISGLTPDIYIAVALGLVCKKVEKVSFPITISGICPSSGSTASATGAHTGELKDAPHFRGHEYYSWDHRIPDIYTVETIWAETALHAVIDMGEEICINKLNLPFLISRLWWKYPQFKEVLLTHSRELMINIYLIRILAFKDLFHNLVRRVWRRLIRKPGDVVKFYQINDIESASSIIKKLLSKHHCEFRY